MRGLDLIVQLTIDPLEEAGISLSCTIRTVVFPVEGVAGLIEIILAFESEPVVMPSFQVPSIISEWKL